MALPSFRFTSLIIIAALALTACADGCGGDEAAEEQERAPRPDVTFLQFGTYHFCTLDDLNQVWCAGSNARGQLGDGSDDDRDELTRVTGIGEMSGLAVGLFDTTCAWNEGGDLFCWGSNEFGVLASEDLDQSSTPVRIDGLPPVKDVTLGGFHACAVTDDDEAYCWGRNDKGQIGVGGRQGDVIHTPQQVTIPGGVHQIQVGGAHSCAVNQTGELFCWGTNAEGQLGIALDAVAAVTLPEPVVFLPGAVVDLKVAFRHTCILVGERRRLYCWGDNSQGQFGLDDLEPRFEPVEIADIAYADELAVAAGQTCARIDDQVYCAGEVLRPVEVARETGEGYFFRPSQALQHTEQMWSGGLAICGLADEAALACRGVQPGGGTPMP